MNWRDERPDGRWLLLVLVAHLALAWLLLLATGRKAAPPLGAEARSVLMVWLREQPPARVAARSPSPAAAALRWPRPAAQPVPPSPRQPATTAAPEPISLPISAPLEPSASSASPPSPATSAPLPLNLQLPRHWAASAPPAALTRKDPRLGSPMNRSERFADQMGTDQTLVEETTATGRRLRRGDACIEVRPSRDSQLDPFNSSVRPRPALASSCRETGAQPPSRSRRAPP